jgi:hypothetical protein
LSLVRFFVKNAKIGKTRAKTRRAQRPSQIATKSVPIPAPAAEELTADSMHHAAGLIGCDLKDLKRAKAMGCQAFVGSRVKISLLRAWLAENQHNPALVDKERLECRRLEEQIASLELRNEVARQKYWLAEEVRAKWLSHITTARSILLGFKILAPQLAGKSAIEIAVRLTEECNKFLDELRKNPYGAG